jgi:lipoprotein-anchoring transpeptidase ErfK/SrfK
MTLRLSRRDFLKICGMSATSLGFRSLFGNQVEFDSSDLARVAVRSVNIYTQPSDKSTLVYQRFRDDLINLYYQVYADQSPINNPIWFRVWLGYVHSAHLQKVEFKLNTVLTNLPKTGQLAQVTVPFSQTMRYSVYNGWEPEYRLYYGSNHWLMGVEVGPDGQPWYRIQDELLDTDYLAPAVHFRPIQPEEIAPISPDVPFSHKRIDVSLGNQELTAYENDNVVLHTTISSGLSTAVPLGAIPTKTPTGKFNVQVKMPSKHMGDGNLTSDTNAYELPGVPWVTFFAQHGVAFHGTYWHMNFGNRMSHGCVNMRTEEALWLYRWTLPIIKIEDWDSRGYGTQITVH